MLDLMPLKQALIDHAIRESPRECCGVAVVRKGRLSYIPCRNAAHEPNRFAIAAEDWAALEDEDGTDIVGIGHSHIYQSAEPSEADRAECQRSGLPWLIVSIPNGDALQINPEQCHITLIGRPFLHGVLDCYSLIQDYYAARGYPLPHFARDEQWWLKGGNLYLDGFSQAGFHAVSDAPREHDVLLMQVASAVPNHAAIMQADGTILQHCQGRLSSRDVYGGYWRKVTTHVLRFNEDLTP